MHTRTVGCLISMLLWPLCGVTTATADSITESPSAAAAEHLVQIALRFELERESTYRDLALAAALSEASDYAPAHWQRGYLQVGREWLSVEDSMEAARLDTDRAEYRRRRNRALGNAQEELELARWCAKHGWKDAERMHLMRVAYAPHRDADTKRAAATKLRLRQYGNLLLPEEEFEKIWQHEQELQAAFREWAPKIRNCCEMLESRLRQRRERARQKLQALTDPAAVPAIEIIMSAAGERYALEAVHVLSRIPEYPATESLVRHAFGAPWPSVARAAVQELKRRPSHDYMPLLLRSLESPILTMSRVEGLQNGAVVRQQVFFREGPQEDHVHFLTATSWPQVRYNKIVNDQSTSDISLDPDDWVNTVSSRTEVVADNRDAMYVAEHVEAKIDASRVTQQVAAANQQIAARNNRTYDVLEELTEFRLRRRPSDWWDWWTDYNEQYTVPKQTRYTSESYTGRYSPEVTRYETIDGTYIGPPPRTSCFRAGTLVWTDAGTVPIETITIGDRVLSQHPDTGELAFKLVTCRTLRPPSPILEVSVGASQIQVTRGHPFWVNGEAWRMAKLLEPGQQMHSVRGGLTVNSVRDLQLEDQAVNLIVDGFGTYFVGREGVLVHDNTDRKPTAALVPGWKTMVSDL